MIYADFHTHTFFSGDSETPPNEMVERAISLGLKYYCITDHMDKFYPGSETIFEFNPEAYARMLSELRYQFKGKIEILFGVELGLRNETDLKEKILNIYKSLTACYPFDFIIGSTHVLSGIDPYYKEYWENKTISQGLTDYFASIAENAAFYPCFDIYGHLDYLIRYFPESETNKNIMPNQLKTNSKYYNYEEYSDKIDCALHSILDHNKGIELNTSGYKYGLGTPHPKEEILRRYLELGGEIITVGSDAHKPEHIAYDFKKAEELLKSIGFRYYTIFKNRKPIMLPL